MRTPIRTETPHHLSSCFGIFDADNKYVDLESVCDALNKIAAEVDRLEAKIKSQDLALDIKRDHICELEDQLQNSEQY